MEVTWKDGHKTGRVIARFPQAKGEIELFYKEGELEKGTKERVTKGEVTKQMREFVKKIDI